MSSSHTGQTVSVRGNLEVRCCLDCGYRHLWPLPDPAERERYYREEYYKDTAGFEKERLDHEAGYWQALYDYQMGLLEPFQTVIDWGAGAGWFIHAAWKRRKIAFGIEPNRLARRYAGEVGNRYLLESLAEAGEYLDFPKDASRLTMVLEHVPDPVGFLRQVAAVTRGKILIVVPNEFNPLQKRLVFKYGGHWYIDKNHINYFNPQGLRNVILAAGLRPVWWGATCPIEAFCWLGLDYRANPALGARAHLWRLRLEKWFGARMFRLYRRLFLSYGWGRELMVVCEKVSAEEKKR